MLPPEPNLEVRSRLPKRANGRPPLLFVHGGYCDGWCWEPHFLPWFAARGYAAHALSLRGHGRSGGQETMFVAGLDDFGTGYSSLSHLKHFPIDTLKIDISFIADIETDPGDAAITEAIIALARGLGLRVVAEGVATQEQFDFLGARGCHCFQGFLISKALPAAEFVSFSRARALT